MNDARIGEWRFSKKKPTSVGGLKSIRGRAPRVHTNLVPILEATGLPVELLVPTTHIAGSALTQAQNSAPLLSYLFAN